MIRNRLFLLFLLLNFAVIPFRATASSHEKINITIHIDDAYPPYSFADEDGNAKGLYIDILRTAFARLEGYQVTLKPVPWQRGKHLMERGEGIGLTPAYYHGHDWPYLYPYSLPFYIETVKVFCREGILKPKQSQSWPTDFKAFRIGNVQGFDGWGGAEFHQMVKDKQIKYEETPSSTVLIKKGMLGRVDCLLMEATAFKLEYSRLKKELEERGTPYNPLVSGPVTGEDPVYIGYSKPARLLGEHPYMLDFMQAVDNQIYLMQKSGEIDRIMSLASQ